MVASGTLAVTSTAAIPWASAVFSDDRRYRYLLTRRFGYGPTVAFVGLNPSTADEHTDDPTIRRCIGFAKRWGYGALLMLNLYALRSTDPKGLWRCEGHPVAPSFENDLAIAAAALHAELVICAWGADSGPFPGQPDHVLRLLAPGPTAALGLTKHGHPRHPLYMRADVQPVPFPATPGGPDGKG